MQTIYYMRVSPNFKMQSLGISRTDNKYVELSENSKEWRYENGTD